MKFPKRVDANQKEIVKGLRAHGASVLHLHEVGKGAPDICVGFKGVNYLLEIKDGEKQPSQQKLTHSEQMFFDSWLGQVHKINSLQQAINVITDNILECQAEQLNLVLEKETQS